jgi:hypothetical protein
MDLALAQAETAQLYVAMFGRAPDAEGLEFWSQRLVAGAMPSQIADAMFATAPARSYFPDGATASQIVASFYQNVLGRPADAEGLAFWTNELSAPGATAGTVISQLVDVVSHYAGTDPDGLASAAYFANRSSAALYYGVNGGTIEHAQQVLDGVASPQSVIDAHFFEWDNASGRIDAGGFSNIWLEWPAGDVLLANVTSGSIVHLDYFDLPEFSVEIDPLHPTADGNVLGVNLPVTSGAHTVHLTLGGQVDELTLSANGAPVTDIVELGNVHVDTLTVVGIADMVLMNADPVPNGQPNLDVHTIDATRLLAGSSLMMELDAGQTLYCGDANNFIVVSGSGGTVHGGAGDDRLRAFGAAALVGEDGNDTFGIGGAAGGETPVIVDFHPNEDKLDLSGIVTSHPANAYGTWYSSQIALASDATFASALSAAASPKNPDPSYAAISWFQFGGDTYVVVDNSPIGTSWQPGQDMYVKLTGVVELSTLKYDATLGVLG